MTRIGFTREITIEYSTRTFELDEVPDELRFLFFTIPGIAPIALRLLTQEQQDALDDFLGSQEWELGETISSTESTLTLTED